MLAGPFQAGWSSVQNHRLNPAGVEIEDPAGDEHCARGDKGGDDRRRLDQCLGLDFHILANRRNRIAFGGTNRRPDVLKQSRDLPRHGVAFAAAATAPQEVCPST